MQTIQFQTKLTALICAKFPAQLQPYRNPLDVKSPPQAQAGLAAGEELLPSPRDAAIALLLLHQDSKTKQKPKTLRSGPWLHVHVWDLSGSKAEARAGAGIHRPPATAKEPLFAPLGAPGGAGSTRLRGRGERDREREDEAGEAEGTGGSGTAAPGWAERPAAPLRTRGRAACGVGRL